MFLYSFPLSIAESIVTLTLVAKSAFLEMSSSNTVSGYLAEEYHKGRAILLKPPALRSQGEIKLLRHWLLERVKLFVSLQLNEGL